jgi:hypothetical protein
MKKTVTTQKTISADNYTWMLSSHVSLKVVAALYFLIAQIADTINVFSSTRVLVFNVPL